ncbi:hypothetical protein FSP39_015244 [Pinctada imbricata]|uniref:Major facilitator superfamily (MFS) profile domain-containing protein n=1 Tax=Pinctada imbricata TaxID=66713 RepID=A0AA88YER2_PINIB|nr:hypothetical protein FSP39_015244 [Pinctada imbricata]
MKKDKYVFTISGKDVIRTKDRDNGGVGVPSTVLEPPNVYKSRWRSIRVMYLTMFLSSVSFSICMSSIWPYLKLLDRSATADLLGWVVASYSLGQLVASPLFGAVANKFGRSREPLVVSIIINIAANLLYAYLEDIKSYHVFFLILARSLIGFGAGNVAVVRSYVSGATTIKERTSAMANMSACQAIGFIIGPGIQIAMVPIGYPGAVHMTGLHIDLYTSPAFLSAFVGVINIILLFVVFREHRVLDDEDCNFSIQSDSGPSIPDYKPDYIAVISTIVIFFVVLFVFAVFETIGTPLTMDMYAWTRSQATLYNGIILATGGIIAIVSFVIIKIISKKVNERYILLGGFLLCFLGFIVYLPWGNEFPAAQMQDYEHDHAAKIHNTTMLPFSQPALPDFHNETTTPRNNGTGKEDEPTGCPDSYAWCAFTPVVRLWQFLLGTFLICVGYPTCNVMSYTLFSKILGPKPQGTWMGWLTASGSLARTIGPIFVSQVYNSYGPRVTFISMSGVVLFTIGGFCGIYRKLVPFKFIDDGE